MPHLCICSYFKENLSEMLPFYMNPLKVFSLLLTSCKRDEVDGATAEPTDLDAQPDFSEELPLDASVPLFGFKCSHGFDCSVCLTFFRFSSNRKV